MNNFIDTIFSILGLVDLVTVADLFTNILRVSVGIGFVILVINLIYGLSAGGKKLL